MTCTAEEFLLFVEHWRTESATIVLMFKVSGLNPTQPAFALGTEGRIETVDLDSRTFTFAREDGAIVIIINLNEWSQIGYAGGDDYGIEDSINEGFSIARAGASISLRAKTYEAASK